MVNRAREVLQYRESKDLKVSQADIEVRTGRKWRAQEAVDQAESRLRHKDLWQLAVQVWEQLRQSTTTNLRARKGRTWFNVK